MTTIKEHFENIKNDKLREVLIHNLYFDKADVPVTSLAKAILSGFNWDDNRMEPKTNNGAAKYWSDMYNLALYGKIELINPTLEKTLPIAPIYSLGVTAVSELLVGTK